ncbi:hypothetical protein NUW58_g6005 [Xylaria curta]|uniref:Uncharacterized protein n=1 Tax=Xylaria curta TaxID=42375 RepID=A0ACC1NYV9_9PEZI|nr:hypothetical protein NUW58_g6005 [Xylaria curta]
MTLLYNQKEYPVLVLLDTGSTVPVLSMDKARQWGLPQVRRKTRRPLTAFNATVDDEGGKYYSEDLIIRHRDDHFSRINFELSKMDEECDIILPLWWLQEHQPTSFLDPHNKKIRFTSEYCRRNCTSLTTALSPRPFVAALEDSIQKAREAVPGKFKRFLPIMSDEAARRKDPSLGPLYALSERELDVLKPWLEKMLASGRVRKSKSSCAAPMMFAEKKDPEDPLRPVVDYRGLNYITVPVRYPIPLIGELQDRLRQARWFTKIDLKSGFHLVRIKPGDEWKTAFRCRYGLFEYTVMPMGLINAPATFQKMMNDIFHDLIDAGLLVYLDDLLIYAETLEEHDKLVIEVLQRLSKHHLAVAPQKCTWGVQSIEFLGYNISADGIAMSRDKVDTVLQMDTPRSQKEAQSFIGFANFYRRFIKDFSKIARPITRGNALDKKQWEWTNEMKEAWATLKDRFTRAPILVHFDPSKIAIVETDASDFALGGILSQEGTDGKLHPVAFHSRKLLPTEMNYEIHDKELLAIVDCLLKWKQYLEGAKHRIEIYSDHQNLAYFTVAKVLNRRQARWAQQLSSYWFVIHYRPGRQNEKADIMSRQPKYRPEKGGSEDQPITSVLQEKHFSHSTGPRFSSSTTAVLATSARICSLSVPQWTPDFINRLKEAAKSDPEYQAQLARPFKDVEQQQGLLYRKGRLWVPLALQREVLESEHDTRVAGHMGMDKTAELVTRNFWWPNLENMVREYVRGCLECQQNKGPRHAPYGPLQPMELHYKPWQTVAMDFITDLPLSNGCDSIWVMVDPFTKMGHFIALKVDGKKTEDLIRIFAKAYWRLHGVPLDIISDRDSRFTAHLWKDFLRLVGIRSRMSTAFHPPTDGQTERLNQILEIYLRAFVNYEMTNWEDLLPTAEFAYNNTISSSTGLSPFYANYGYHPSANNPPTSNEIVKNPGSRLYFHWMTQVHDHAKKHLEASRTRMKEWADKRRKEAPAYAEDQLVMLNARNIKTKRPAKKLDKKMLGPFKIQKVISPTAVRLTLPKGWRIHNSFHVLRQADPIEAEDYQVDEVKDSIETEGHVKYLVKWEGWPAKRHWTWEPYEHFYSEGSKAAVLQFHQGNPGKPRDPRWDL